MPTRYSVDVNINKSIVNKESIKVTFSIPNFGKLKKYIILGSCWKAQVQSSRQVISRRTIQEWQEQVVFPEASILNEKKLSLL